MKRKERLEVDFSCARVLGVVVKQEFSRTTTTATNSRDLFQDLQPSVHIHKWFGKEITFKYHANRHSTNQALPVMEESKALIGPAKYTRAQTEIINVNCAKVRGVGFEPTNPYGTGT